MKKIDKLISCEDFVIGIYKDLTLSPDVTDGFTRLLEVSKATYNYAKFLTQPLELGMFIPCDEEGEVLSDPELTMQQGDGTVYYSATKEEFDEYEEAENRVLFRGFVFSDKMNLVANVVSNVIVDFDGRKIGNISSLTPEEIVLTPNALKLIYGE